MSALKWCILIGKGNIEQIDGVLYSAATVESTRKTNKVNNIVKEKFFSTLFYYSLIF